VNGETTGQRKEWGGRRSNLSSGWDRRPSPKGNEHGGRKEGRKREQICGETLVRRTLYDATLYLEHAGRKERRMMGRRFDAKVQIIFLLGQKPISTKA
jgi:hypothetical protein